MRKPIDWIQPPTLTGRARYEPTVKLEHLLAQVKTVPEMQVSGWEDIRLLDLRPNKGIVKVRNHRHLETQIDAATGDILQVAQRRNDVVVFWHEGSVLGARLWVFLPAGIGALILVLTGIYLNIKMTAIKLRRWRNRRQLASQSQESPRLPHPGQRTLKALLLRYHYWLGWIVMLPWLIVIVSGLALQVRYEVPWVLPVLQPGRGATPTMEFAQMLTRAQTEPTYGVTSWPDVWRVYVYPNRGISTIRAKNRWEFQFDSATHEIVHIAVRRTDWIEDIHEGKLFGLGENLWLFLPIHILSIALWCTGTICALPKRRRAAAPSLAQSAGSGTDVAV